MIPGKIPSERAGRWKLLDELLSAWFGVNTPSGYPTSELDSVESDLGVKIPVALREWYTRYGRLDMVWQPQDHLLAPTRWKIKDDILTFCVENQSVVSWAIDVRSPEIADPPVMLRQCRSDEWNAESESVSLFAIQFALMNVKWSAFVRNTANGETTDRQFSAIESKFERLAIPDLKWPASPTRFYGTENLLIEAHGKDWIWVTALTADALDEVAELAAEVGLVWNQIEGSS